VLGSGPGTGTQDQTISGETVAKARRAKTRPSRMLIPLLALTLVAAVVITWQVRADSGRSEPQDTAGRAVARATASPTPTAGSSAGSAARAEQALRSCRRGVDAADAVLAAARTGVGHWAAHVQAQTDADAGEITVQQKNAVFGRTRRAGSDDQSRYRRAKAAYERTDGSCARVAGAPASTTSALARCRTRAAAQRPVLEAAAPAMQDWRHHLEAMMASRMHQVSNPDQVWVHDWRAAPPHIEAYVAATEHFDAPRC